MVIGLIKKSRGMLFLNYFKPSIYIESIYKLNLESLRNQGIKVIITDLDNTLIDWSQRIPSQQNLDFFESCRRHNIEIIIFSNNIHSRVERFAKKAGIKNYFWDCKKPLLGKMKYLKKHLPYKEREMIMIGDQLITDVLVANRSHIKSVLVTPLSRINNGNKIIGVLEKWISKWLAQKNILHEGFYQEGEMSNNYELL